MNQSTVKILHSLSEITARDWDSCALGAGPYNPFLSHKFLYALERSGSVCKETGWQPFHLIVENEEGKRKTLVGVVPMYLKNHSQGEYVFDHGWAEALHRAGGSYYPKLQSSIPFTPATGARLLCRDGSAASQDLLLSACAEVSEQIKTSSLHMTFMPEDQWHRAGELGFLKRMDQQFHWHNANYKSFDDFLLALTAKKRKNLKRERREALSQGIEIQWVTGADISESHWDAFYEFYLDTGQRKWGTPYLNREFFSLIGETMSQDILLIMARREGRYVAGALNFIGENTLFGRNWGCIEDHRFLHFEVCYYQAIDFAIARGLKTVEAGAQGGHKVIRGYLPTATYSAHWIADPAFKDAVAKYLEQERSYVEEDIAHVEQSTPFNALTDLNQIRSAQIIKDSKEH